MNNNSSDSSIVQSILDGLSSLLHGVFDFGASALSAFFDFFKSMFSVFFSWLFDLIFVDLRTFIVSAGSKLFTLLYDEFSLTSVFSLQTLFYVIGLILVIFAVKRLISVIRG